MRPRQLRPRYLNLQRIVLSQHRGLHVWLVMTRNESPWDFLLSCLTFDLAIAYDTPFPMYPTSDLLMPHQNRQRYSCIHLLPEKPRDSLLPRRDSRYSDTTKTITTEHSMNGTWLAACGMLESAIGKSFLTASKS